MSGLEAGARPGWARASALLSYLGGDGGGGKRCPLPHPGGGCGWLARSFELGEERCW